jgi:hypothetical protein
MPEDPTQIAIDFMILADGAQAVGGKLYMLGGGWTHLFVPQFPGKPQAPFALAVGISVPYHLTNRRFSFAVELTDSDGERVGELLTAEFEQGRPPGLRPGANQPILLAVNAHPDFPAPGRYTFKASVDGEQMRTASFEVVPQTSAPAAPENE